MTQPIPLRAGTPLDTIHALEPDVACDGGGGALGHPLVYLHLLPTGRVLCPYCSRLYVLGALDTSQD
jgi:uncharacterized Zn-finger protein